MQISADENLLHSVIFGMDSKGIPRASAFEASDFKAAEKAANSMNLSFARLIAPEAISVALRLPKGKIYGSGRGFVPPVGTFKYKKLCAALSNTKLSAQPKSDSAPEGRASSGSDEFAWKVGDIVLACEASNGGFFESIITEINGETLTLTWQGWPNHPPIRRQRTQVSALPSEFPYW